MELDLVLNWAWRFLNLKKCVKVEIGFRNLKTKLKCTPRKPTKKHFNIKNGTRRSFEKEELSNIGPSSKLNFLLFKA
jgi:hypothetical protein